MMTKEEAAKAYADLIQLRQSEIPKKTTLGGIEVHHVVPISCKGLDVDDNKIALYAREHFMAHVYLWAIHHDDEFHFQTTYALNMMAKGTLAGQRRELRDFILASEEYQKAREELSELMSKTIGQKVSGKSNGVYGKHWYHDPATLKSKLFFPDEVPDGWEKGNRSLSRSQIQAWTASGSESIKGKHAFHNNVTGQTIFLADEDAVPEGFTRGKGSLSEEQKQKMRAAFASRSNSTKNPERIHKKIEELRPMYKVYLDQSFEAVQAMFGYKHSLQNFCMACRMFLPEYMNGARRKRLSYEQVWKMHLEPSSGTEAFNGSLAQSSQSSCPLSSGS